MRKSQVLVLLQEICEGLPCVIGEYDMSIPAEVTEKDVVHMLRRLLNSEQAMTVRTRFMMGDLYNSIHKVKGLRKQVAQAIEGEFGLKTYQMLRTYGWVSAKWTIPARSDRHPWTHYLRNKEGEEIRNPNENETPLEPVRVDRRGDGIFVHCQTRGKRRFVIMLTDSMLDVEYGTPERHEALARFFDEDKVS